MKTDLKTLLDRAAQRHKHLCPRQVLGVRMGMYAAELLELELPQTDKRLYTFVETDGCFTDGVAVATGCWVGRRTMRVIDFGKVAATFVDTKTNLAMRIYPHLQSRQRWHHYAPDAQSRWHGYLQAYQVMPAAELLVAQPVELTRSMQAILSNPGARTVCAQCGEEIINERQVMLNDRLLCRGCAGENYYRIRPSHSSNMMKPTSDRTITSLVGSKSKKKERED
jgi:formylmethanofuran dehydrogenase subunit E